VNSSKMGPAGGRSNPTPLRCGCARATWTGSAPWAQPRSQNEWQRSHGNFCAIAIATPVLIPVIVARNSRRAILAPAVPRADFRVHPSRYRRWRLSFDGPVVTVTMDAKTEIRVKGPNVTPGYHGDDQATRAAFDEEGYYRTGDAVRLVDPATSDAGLQFDGRITEDFKLMTGTWVSVGTSARHC
jgi:acyl-CoA synthetase (AMP-forming)/AMP-acid ligase II